MSVTDVPALIRQNVVWRAVVLCPDCKKAVKTVNNTMRCSECGRDLRTEEDRRLGIRG
jgi:Zn finger protein HypA/HybF involved in hydrogenase expression